MVHGSATEALGAEIPSNSSLFDLPRALLRVDIPKGSYKMIKLRGKHVFLCKLMTPVQGVMLYKRETGMRPTYNDILTNSNLHH